MILATRLDPLVKSNYLKLSNLVIIYSSDSWDLSVGFKTLPNILPIKGN